LIAPKIKELLKRHRTKPIAARVTLTSGTLDITRIYRHLTEEIGFVEVGFAPVTTSPGQKVRELETTDSTACSVSSACWRRNGSSTPSRTRHHGFSNVTESLEEIHKGVSKAYPCGAGLGLLGRLDRRRCRAVSSVCRVRRPQDGHGARRRGSRAQIAFLEKNHIATRRLQQVLGPSAVLGRLLP